MDETDTCVNQLIDRIWHLIVGELTSRRFWKFLAGTFGGLLTDIAVFSVLVALDVIPGMANLFSATAGLLVVYFLATKYAFKARHEWWRFGTFVAWYCVAITFWAFTIQVLSSETRMQPIFAKVLTIPFSFGINFAFSRLLFGPRFWAFLKAKLPFRQS